MKTRRIVTFIFFAAALICRSSGDNSVIDVSANFLLIDAASGATMARDVWGDTWFPEWNTLGDAVGYRNDNPDPNVATFSLAGNVLTATKVIDATGGEDRWDKGALLVFGYDGTQFVRFGMWSSPGGGALKGSTQTLTFTVPNWVKGQILYEYWTWYGAVNNINNWFFDATNGRWVKQDLKSHLARSLGNAGIDVTTFVPAQLTLRQTPSSPSGSITASSTAITLGDPVTFALVESGADNTGITFTGDAVNLTTPPSSVTVTPDAAGAQNYLLTVPGSVMITWTQPDPGNTVILKTPTGDVDVTRAFRYLATANQGGSGVYSVIQTDPWGVSSVPQPVTISLPSPFNTTAVVNVTGVGSASLAVVPNARCWVAGAGYTAYLARHDVVMEGTSVANAGQNIQLIEIQAMNPRDGVWQTISTRNYANVSNTDDTFAFAIDTVLGGPTDPNNLVPRDPTLVGTWQYRLHALMASGRSAYSGVVPVNVILPIKTTSVVAQTLPPAGLEGWFNASGGKTYSFQLLVP